MVFLTLDLLCHLPTAVSTFALYFVLVRRPHCNKHATSILTSIFEHHRMTY